MHKPKKAKRKFAKSYTQLLEQAQVMLENFIEDQPQFIAKYLHMDAAYATDWQTAIDNADNTPDDEAVVDEHKEKTEELTDTMRSAQDKYSTLTSYLRMIYKENIDTVLLRFGYRRWRRNRNRQLKLKELMSLAYARANSAPYKQPLIDKGFLQADIDALNTLAQQLEDTNIEQEKKISDRPELLQDRITLHNTVWDYMVEVNIASKVVFADDYARQQHYLLYPERNNLDVLSMVQDAIAPGGVFNAGVIPPGTKRIRMTVLLNGALEFGMSNDGVSFIGNTTALGAPNSVSYDIEDFGAVGSVFIVKNQNNVLGGEFKIEFLG